MDKGILMVAAAHYFETIAIALPNYPTVVFTARTSMTVCLPNLTTSVYEVGAVGRWRRSALSARPWHTRPSLLGLVSTPSCCLSCWESIFLINDEIVLARVAVDGDTKKVRRLVSQMGSDILYEALSIQRSYCMRRGMAIERLYVCC
jgi:hypothetical protein